MISEKLYLILWSEEIIVIVIVDIIWYVFCNDFDLKITLRILNPENNQEY